MRNNTEDALMTIKDSTDDIYIALRKPRRDLTGSRFGKLVAESYAGKSSWACKCDCGSTTKVLTANLLRGNTRSCGCIRNHMSTVRNTKHGLYGTKVYKCWCSIKKRCTNPKDASYPSYGGAGIRLCDEWLNDPHAFYEHVGHAPTDHHSIDRKDNSKGYEPGNVRWANKWEQATNRRSSKWVVFQGNRMTLAQLARLVASECGISAKDFKDALSAVIKEGAAGS